MEILFVAIATTILAVMAFRLGQAQGRSDAFTSRVNATKASTEEAETNWLEQLFDTSVPGSTCDKHCVHVLAMAGAA